ncbi:flagellar hook-length control protein [Corallococcus terminator]|uniref:Flagellar hook-length control protein n=2 Tax=Corallococcus terminator TaxID=2316733 RepID=A0A3A8JL21_9BACT|nr:flagellar hook-length control protein [Corallococcus terminator]
MKNKSGCWLLGVSLFLLPLAPPAEASGGRGMSWAKVSHSSGVDEVGCWGCDAYVGETSCTTALPLLCIRQDGSARPAQTPASYYPSWAAGNIATTLPISGSLLTSLSSANQMCVQFFGAGWRMAEFHDAGGWGFNAYGNVRTDTRFWVHINDQPANCWNP